MPFRLAPFPRPAYALACALACAATMAATPSPSWSDSGIRGPKYAQILDEMEGWKREFPQWVTIKEYGKSVGGRPLRLVLAMEPGEFSERPTLVLSGSTHGDEYLHIEDRLPAALLKTAAHPGPVRRFLDGGGAFVFIPILNPDGYDARSRMNANGVDLNRDWDLGLASFKGFREIETQRLAEALEELHRGPLHLSYRITVDYHCCGGALLYPWAYKSEHMSHRDFERHVAIAQTASKLLHIDSGATGEVLGYFPVGTTKDYYYSHYGALSFTYEGRFGAEDRYFDQHLAWWEAMTNTLEAKLPSRTSRISLASPPRQKKARARAHVAD